jgi:MscS family membrane protein
VVAWLGIALVVMLLIHPSLKALASRTRTDVDIHIVQILKFPVFAVLFAFGVKQSLEVFALPVWAFNTLDRFYSIVLIIAIVYVAFRIWHEIVLIYGRRARKRLGTRVDTRLLNVFDKTGGVIIVVVGLFYLVHSFGINLTVFAAGGVLVSMVIAFAAQDTLSNFFSGIHLLLDQPFKEGDDIILDTGEVVTVTKIGLRSTHLYHVANHETIIVPNNLLATHRVINLLQPDRKYKVRVDIGVAYGTDVPRVMEILLDIARSHPLSLDEDGRRPFVRFQNFGDSSLDFSLHTWIEDVYTRFAVASDIRQAIDRRFAEEGIEIPFPQRVIWDGRSEKDSAGERPKDGRSSTAPLFPARDPRKAMQEQESGSETGGASESGSAESGSADAPA